MRVFAGLLFCSLYLSGCIHYAGMHSTAHQENLASLMHSHQHYPVPHEAEVHKHSPKYCKANPFNWWERFHDAQLNQLIEIALADSPTVLIAQARIQKSEQLANSAEASLWPVINLFGYQQRERFPKYGLVPPPFNGRTFNISDIGLNFNYEFDFWGKHREELAARISETCAVAADWLAAQLMISTSLASNYFQLIAQMEKYKVARALFKQHQRILRIITYRSRHGIQSDIPVKTAETNKQVSELTVSQLKDNIARLRHQIALLMGKNPLTTVFDLPSRSLRAYHAALPNDLPLNLISQRPDLMATKARAEAAAHRIKVAKARFYPNVNLSLLYSYQSIFFNRLFNHESQNNAATGAFDLPIFDAGERRSQLGIRYAEYDEAVNQYNQTLLTALKEVGDQLSSLNTLKSQLKAQTSALSASKHHYKLIQLRYQHGIDDNLTVLYAEGLLLEQQHALIDYQARQLLAAVAMIKALGGNTTLPKDHYDCCRTA